MLQVATWQNLGFPSFSGRCRQLHATRFQHDHRRFSGSSHGSRAPAGRRAARDRGLAPPVRTAVAASPARPRPSGTHRSGAAIAQDRCARAAGCRNQCSTGGLRGAPTRPALARPSPAAWVRPEAMARSIAGRYGDGGPVARVRHRPSTSVAAWSARLETGLLQNSHRPMTPPMEVGRRGGQCQTEPSEVSSPCKALPWAQHVLRIAGGKDSANIVQLQAGQGSVISIRHVQRGGSVHGGASCPLGRVVEYGDVPCLLVPRQRCAEFRYRHGISVSVHFCFFFLQFFIKSIITLSFFLAMMASPGL